MGRRWNLLRVMATPIAGHPLAIVPSQPKPKKLEIGNALGLFIDRTIGIFSPDAGKRRMHSRMWLNKFSYEGARPGTWRSQATLSGNASPETTSLNYDRIRLIWEARDLEQNFPFVKRMLSMFCDYVLGDFRIKSKATSEADRKAVDDYWDLCCQYSDPTGRLSFQDQCHLALRSQVRDGDMIGQKILENFTVPTPTGEQEMEFYQLRLIEADRIGYPYEGSIGDGYLNGTIFDPETGYIKGYRIFQRDYLSNTYSNPQDVISSDCLYIGKHQRADSLRCVSEFAPCIPTARDIQEIIENERLAVKWCSSQAGVVTRLGGTANYDDDIYTDPFQAPLIGSNGQKLTNASPGAIQYLAPGEDWKAFEYNRASPAFIGLLQTLYRDCCLSVEVPFGFAYEPTTNGIASRLESAQARRTFTSRQRLMRDKLIMPFRNQCLIHGLQSGQLKLSPQGETELLEAKIIWPAHPTVDVGRESTANVSEYNANLKAGETIAEERGDDYDEMVGQIEYEDRKKRKTLGLAQSVINNFGSKGIDGLFQIYTQVSSGAIPPENARQMLKTLFGLNDEEANEAIPANFKIAPPPIAPVPGVGKKPAQTQQQTGLDIAKFSGPEDEERDDHGRWTDGGEEGGDVDHEKTVKDAKDRVDKALQKHTEFYKDVAAGKHEHLEPRDFRKKEDETAKELMRANRALSKANRAATKANKLTNK